MNTVRRVQVSIGRPHAAIQTWRNAKRLTECPGERLKGCVIGIQTDFRYRKLRARQLPRRSFQQQSPPHGNRGFLDHRPKQPIKLGSAPMSVAGETFGVLLLVERFQNHPTEPLRFVHKRKISFQGRRAPDRKSQNFAASPPRIRRYIGILPSRIRTGDSEGFGSYSALREAMSIEKRYFTSDLSSLV